MVKSDRVTVSSRVEDVLQLLLDGADFEAIRQYASAQQWNVSDRQLRRYIESAHKEVVSATQQTFAQEHRRRIRSMTICSVGVHA